MAIRGYAALAAMTAALFIAAGYLHDPATPLAPPRPALADEGELVVAFSNHTGIQLVTTNGRALGHVTTGQDFGFEWSPDGRQIVFQRDEPPRAIYVVDTEGGNERLLAEGTHPSWSPDGTLIAYFGADGLFAVSPEGGTPRRVSHQTPLDSQPSWSPDSSLLTFAGVNGLTLVTLDGEESVLHPGLVHRPKWSRTAHRSRSATATIQPGSS